MKSDRKIDGWLWGICLARTFNGLVFMTYTESVSVSYMGAAFGLRSMLGFSAGAISPVVLGAVLDMTNPGVVENGVYTNWAENNSVYATRPAEQLEQIAALVRTAIGFDTSRGDQIEVVNMQFQDHLKYIVLDGHAYRPGVTPLLLTAPMISRQQPADGDHRHVDFGQQQGAAR